jgi:hypothetical protein
MATRRPHSGDSRLDGLKPGGTTVGDEPVGRHIAAAMASCERPALASLSLNVTDDVNADDATEDSTSCALFASPVSRFAPSTRRRARDDDDDDRSSALAVSTSDAETRCAIDANATHSAIALLVERDAAIEREQAVVAFAREQMRTFDEDVGALTRDVRDLMLALGEAHADQTRARWRWAIKTVVSIVRADRERREAKRAKARARRLEEQLRRVEKYIAAAANDFDELNAKLVKEVELVKDAREGERRALEMLENERKMRESSPSTPPPRRAANERRAAAKAACASVAAHVESLLSKSPSKQLNDIARAQREATERARIALEGAAAARTSDGELDPKDVVALIAVHALERCAERSSSDGERAFFRAAKRFESVARVCSSGAAAGAAAGASRPP